MALVLIEKSYQRIKRVPNYTSKCLEVSQKHPLCVIFSNLVFVNVVEYVLSWLIYYINRVRVKTWLVTEHFWLNSVFQNVMKHFILCDMSILSKLKTRRTRRNQIIKINASHGSDFLCFNSLNYCWVWEGLLGFSGTRSTHATHAARHFCQFGGYQLVTKYGLVYISLSTFQPGFVYVNHLWYALH